MSESAKRDKLAETKVRERKKKLGLVILKSETVFAEQYANDDDGV